VDLLSVFLAVLLAGLAGTLALIAFLAGRRYGEARLFFVAASFALLSIVGMVALVGAISPRYGGGLQVDALPLLLLVASSGLLYLAVVRGRTHASVPQHGWSVTG
jgi:hypothetical protein